MISFQKTLKQICDRPLGLLLSRQAFIYQYVNKKLCDTCLEAVREEKVLGVMVDEKLKFDTHTVTQANKANRVLGLVRRTFDNLDEEMLVLLYKSLVRLHLEYCHAVVYPQYVKQEKMLEAVQINQSINQSINQFVLLRINYIHTSHQKSRLERVYIQ